MITAINSREAVPVMIDEILLYCESFKASGTRIFSEQSTVTGRNEITCSYPKTARLTFSGRVCSENAPLDVLVRINELIRGNVSCDIEYRGVIFMDCYVQSFAVEDCGEDYISASVTVVTNGAFDEVSG